MNYIEEIKEILIANVYNECFEDTEFNIAVSELNTLLQESNEKEYRGGFTDAMTGEYNKYDVQKGLNEIPSLKKAYEKVAGAKPNDTTEQNETPEIDKIMNNAIDCQKNNIYPKYLNTKPQDTTEHDKKIAEEAVEKFATYLRLDPLSVSAYFTYLSSRGDKGEI